MAIAVGIDAARTDVANDGLYRTLGLAVGGMASGIRSVDAVRFTTIRIACETRTAHDLAREIACCAEQR
jgi:hypothetical protein